MKHKMPVLILALVMAVLVLFWAGIGPYYSESAISDLKVELESIYGPEYTEKAVEKGTEDMAFEIEPKTWLLTNWNLRNSLALDYEYECKVIFTTHTDGKTETRTVTYQATDPMGKENMTERARLDLTSKTETTGNE